MLLKTSSMIIECIASSPWYTCTMSIFSTSTRVLRVLWWMLWPCLHWTTQTDHTVTSIQLPHHHLKISTDLEYPTTR